MINPQWLKLPMSWTNFHGPKTPKDVRAIEVRLYLYFSTNPAPRPPPPPPPPPLPPPPPPTHQNNIHVIVVTYYSITLLEASWLCFSAEKENVNTFWLKKKCQGYDYVICKTAKPKLVCSVWSKLSQFFKICYQSFENQHWNWSWGGKKTQWNFGFQHWNQV